MRQLKIGQSITNRDSQAVEKYLNEVSKIPMITPEEEIILAQQRKSNKEGSTEYQYAVDKLAKANLRFVVSVAKQYQHQGLDLPDLINEGNLGLMKAATRFDESRGFKFISYAVWRIRQSILQALADQSRLVRIPQNKIGGGNKVSKARSAFEQEYEREPSDEELAELLEISVDDVQLLLQIDKRHSSLDKPISDEETSATMGDLIAAENNEIHAVLTFENHQELSETTNRMMEVAHMLTAREKEIVYASFGFSGSLTLDEIEQKYDLTRERVRQLKERAIKKLQGKMRGVKRVLGGDEYNPSIVTKNNHKTWLQEKEPLKVVIDNTSPIGTHHVMKDATKKIKKQLKNVFIEDPGNKVKIEDFLASLEKISIQIDNALQQTKDSNMSYDSQSNEDTFINISQQYEMLSKIIMTYKKQYSIIQSSKTIKENINTINQKMKKLSQKLKNYRRLSNYCIHNNLTEHTKGESIEPIVVLKQDIEPKKDIPLSGTMTVIQNDVNKTDGEPLTTFGITTLGQYEEKMNLIIEKNYNWELQLEVSDLVGEKKRCINTFMKHYITIKKSRMGKSYSYTTLLCDAKLRTGLIMGQEQFNIFIAEFLDNIKDL